MPAHQKSTTAVAVEVEVQRELPDRQTTVPVFTRLSWRVEDFFEGINWLHVAFKICAFTYIGLIAYLTWMVLPVNGHWVPSRQSDKLPVLDRDISNYFSSFEGFSDCNVRAKDLYQPLPRNDTGLYTRNAFCPNRKALLESLSSGGRVGFDSPYIPQGCYYRWYTPQEICMILDRFDGVVFVGDDTLQSIYNGFNILLRQDLALGALKAWEMDPITRDNCRCDRQFNTPSCAQYFVNSDKDVKENTPSIGSPHLCSRTMHAMVTVTNPEKAETLRKLIPQVPRSNYRPVPVIHSTSPSNSDADTASQHLLESLKLADESKRKTPLLWIGPPAAGHIDIKGRKGNQEIWDFDRHMAKVAEDNDIEVLKMWNLTVQASSFDGVHFGEKVAITQAMMVVNWLARLESS